MGQYYDHAGITLIEGDCFEVLKTFADKQFDLVLSDPPYGVKYAEWDSDIPPLEWLKESRRVAKAVIFTSGIRHMFDYPRPDWVISWSRSGSTQRNDLGGLNNWEPMLVYGRPPLPNDLIPLAHPGREVLWHPCPKPVALFARVIRRVGATSVLDPFMGSGTAMLAAKNLGVKATGIDIDRGYCERVVERLGQEVFQFEDYAAEEEPDMGGQLFDVKIK